MPFEGISVSDSRVKADSNCLLQILALSRLSVFKIPFSLSELIPNASFLRDLTEVRWLIISGSVPVVPEIIVNP